MALDDAFLLTLVVKSSAPDRKRGLNSTKIVLRLNGNTGRNDFIAAFKPWAAKNLCEGNWLDSLCCRTTM